MPFYTHGNRQGGIGMIEVLDKAGVCELLHITLETLDNQLQLGILPYRKIADTILFTESDIKSFLYDCAVEAKNAKCRSHVGSMPIGG
jgi:hypothetical protein